MKTFVYTKDNPVVQTAQGKVRGYLYDDLCIFKGIPYAQARRFHRPEPAAPWDGVLDATSYGYVCPLLELPKPGGELYVPHRYWVMNEDCQNLNLWTPACDDEKRPVIVWLHGGGYEAGSAIEHIAYDGAAMARLGQAVVISVNHRLNVLGYFDLSEFGAEYEDSGNAGTQDIVAALHWIRENVGAFGGDPDNVTLFGQSGGGAKVTTLLQTPAADGLFHKGLNMSGVIGPMLADATGSGRELAEALLEELGLSGAKELETVPYERLAAAYRKLRPSFEKEGKYTGGKPHPNAFYAGTPEERGFRAETAQLPMMVGSVFGEFGSFAAAEYDKRTMSAADGEAAIRRELGEETADALLPLFREAYPSHNPVDLLTYDTVFRTPEIDYIARRSGQNACTWSYLFDLEFPMEGGRTAWHCADIPFFFHNVEQTAYAQAAEGAERVQEEMFQSLMAFARTGNPNHAGLPHWEASTPQSENTMVFGNKESRQRTNYDHALIAAAVRYKEAFRAYLTRHTGQIQH